MRKLNISGLVKKCKELWSNILEIKEILEEEEVDTDEFPKEEFPQHGHPTEPVVEGEVVTPKQTEHIVLDEVKDLFDSYVGIFVMGFLTYKDDIPDIEPKIQTLIIAGTEIRGNDLWVKLTKVSGGHGGYIKISPSVYGQFVEKSSKDEPTKASRYRIHLYGEDAIEYVDQNNSGQISYFGGYLEG
jgi:hypothetical protein